MRTLSRPVPAVWSYTDVLAEVASTFLSSIPLPNPPITPSRPEPQWNHSKCAMTIWQDKHCGSIPSASNLILWRGKLLDERGALVGVRPVRWKLDGLFSNGPPHHLHKCVGSCLNVGTHRYDHSLIKDLQPWSRQWLSLFRPLYEKTASAWIGWWFGGSDGKWGKR